MRTKRPIGVRNADQFRDKIAKYTEIVVAMARHFGQDPRTEVMNAVREALEYVEDKPWVMTKTVIPEPGAEPEEMELVSVN
jgi:hypothetical protein